MALYFNWHICLRCPCFQCCQPSTAMQKWGGRGSMEQHTQCGSSMLWLFTCYPEHNVGLKLILLLVFISLSSEHLWKEPCPLAPSSSERLLWSKSELHFMGSYKSIGFTWRFSDLQVFNCATFRLFLINVVGFVFFLKHNNLAYYCRHWPSLMIWYLLCFTSWVDFISLGRKY